MELGFGTIVLIVVMVYWIVSAIDDNTAAKNNGGSLADALYYREVMDEERRRNLEYCEEHGHSWPDDRRFYSDDAAYRIACQKLRPRDVYCLHCGTRRPYVEPVRPKSEWDMTEWRRWGRAQWLVLSVTAAIPLLI